MNGFAEGLAALFGERFLSRLQICMCWTAQEAATRHAALVVKLQQNLSIFGNVRGESLLCCVRYGQALF